MLSSETTPIPQISLERSNETGHLHHQSDDSPNDAPIRSEIFGEDRLREHAISLANSHHTTKRGVSYRAIRQRVRNNLQVLARSNATMRSAIDADEVIAPAGEWLVDNFHSVQQHVFQVLEDMPSGYYRQLPKILSGHLAGEPRVMAIAWAYIAHTDSSFHEETLVDFVNAYQSIHILTIGELWAIAIHLRMLLIDNAGRVARRTVVSREARTSADQFTQKYFAGQAEPSQLELLVAGYPSHAQISFLLQVVRNLRAARNLESGLIERTLNLLEARGYDYDSASTEERTRQVANNLTMRNVFLGLKAISELDWESVFRKTSRVDSVFSGHGTYDKLEADSRSIYRRAVEDLAAHSDKDEVSIARLAAAHGLDDDPGYCLIGPGRKFLERQCGYRSSLFRGAARLYKSMGVFGYVAQIFVVCGIIVYISSGTIMVANAGSGTILLLLGIVAVLAFEAATAMTNFAVSQVVRPLVLPGFSFETGIPDDAKTLIAVPALLTHFHGVESLIERIELHYLSEDDPNIYLALVTDWRDASHESVEGDDILLDAAKRGIQILNERHGHNRFMLLHRHRLFNEVDNIWMGWERKRGKLHELNRLLRGATDTSFLHIPSDLPSDIRFVIVLDADTALPRDAAKRLIGKIYHPLNRPKFDPEHGRVTAGYGILQPRITISFPETETLTLFQRISISRPGMDPYVFASSDVYQDLFGEGSFTGKGIYDVAAFEKAIDGRLKENRILSHDLLEGNLARAALVSDVEFVEDFPGSYLVDTARHHRWTRGDWQLLPWLMPFTRGITALGWWKMFDNLRRSLTPICALAALLAGWITLSDTTAISWTMLVLLLMFIPAFLPIFSGSTWRREPVKLWHQFLGIFKEVLNAGRVTLARIVFLVHESHSKLDAITRTIFRMVISKQNMLEWTTAAQMSANLKPGWFGTNLLMITSVTLAAMIVVIGIAEPKLINPVSLVFAALWLLAPSTAFLVSQPKEIHRRFLLNDASSAYLRKVGLLTWRYFDTYVTPTHSMLPPDNLQEDVKHGEAHRTSPTNIGLYLLSSVSSFDLGWIGLSETVDRLDATLTTLNKMEKYRGHIYNWYDTRDLRPLEPKYVSTVDSGNLAGHLIAVANACELWTLEPTLSGKRLAGLLDTLDILSDLALQASTSYRSAEKAVAAVRSQITTISQSINDLQSRPDRIPLMVLGLKVQVNALNKVMLKLWTSEHEIGREDANYWLARLVATVSDLVEETISTPDHQQNLTGRLHTIARELRSLAYDMDFGFLLNRKRNLLSIGYRLDKEALDESCYDLLASEAALTSLVSIAKQDVGAKHWSRLGRSVVEVRGSACLVSWSGSMFEYLMPHLVLHNPAGTLLDQTLHLVVRKQMSYAKSLGLPWGISESAYAARDRNKTYQYSNFGVPDLGLKRGLADNQVIAPYATALAAMVSPTDAVANFERLTSIGARGRYGYYEAVDYTRSRLRKGQSHEVIRAYFAHHQGMTITAIHNVVSGGRLRDYFHRETTIKSAGLLLQERAPSQLPMVLSKVTETSHNKRTAKEQVDASRHMDPTQLQEPVTHLLSNGRVVTMLNAEGGGYIRWNGIAINRWRGDPTLDDDGITIFVRDQNSGSLHTIMNRMNASGSNHTIFSDEKAEFISISEDVTSRVECFVATDDDSEARCIEFINSSSETRAFEFTTYMELALAHPAADASHPAFSKLFIETEFNEEHNALIATRRKRQSNDPDIWVAQFIVSDASNQQTPQYETSREAFLGRGNSIWNANGMMNKGPLGKKTGHVLDPIFALRQSLTLRPHRKIRFVLWTLVAEKRDALLEKLSRHSTYSVFERLQVQAWTQARILLRHLDVDVSEASTFQALASRLIYSNPSLRLHGQSLLEHRESQASLWSLGISGNKPVLVLRVRENSHLAVVNQILRAQNYWHEKLLFVDVVILNDEPVSYLQYFRDALNFAVEKEKGSRSETTHASRGDVFVIKSESLVPLVHDTLLSMAHVILDSAKGPLQSQQELWSPKISSPRSEHQHLSAIASHETRLPTYDLESEHEKLQFFNGFGGFNQAGDEYHILLRDDAPLPAPWINVIANENFGTHCSAEGGGYSWFGNSKEKQLTVWSNDAVEDRPSEIFYVKDLDTGKVSSPCIQPLGRRPGSFKAVHGFGFTRFTAEENEVQLELEHTIAPDDPVKLMRLRVVNPTDRSRRFAVTFYAEIVLGQNRTQSGHHVATTHDPMSDAMFALNCWNSDFGTDVVFADMAAKQTSSSGNRGSFIGYRGDLKRPHAVLANGPLDGQLGQGLDPCVALQTILTVPAMASDEVVVTFGAGRNVLAARDLILKYRMQDATAVSRIARDKWAGLLGGIRIETPDPAFNIMMNGWLLYQTISCRMWGRSGFYQASGAYGFRDQLQDSMTVAHVLPGVARQHLLKAASRQFVQGDVQHWWLPETGAGVRTHISDDTVWLTYCTAYYVRLTGDTSVLDEEVPFLEGRALKQGEHDAFYVPAISQDSASLYEHCITGLLTNFKTGAHGLPLMGTGDWNDGMNRVGEHGQGESVWLGWFLCASLKQFEAIAAKRGDKRGRAWAAKRKSLAAALEKNAWDGAWYRRAFFDDGTPLGTSEASECRIDTIAQSWSVLSGMADGDRARVAMTSVETHLIDHNVGVARLFTPPLQHHVPNAGYVQSYPPGIRENGGQYTHGALWAIFAFAELGQPEKAFNLFSLINPIKHSATPPHAMRYRTEPYVIAADVYSEGENAGRGGWTWYTGAAGWAYRAGLEAVIGIQRRGSVLYIKPRFPASWQDVNIHYRFEDKSVLLHFKKSAQPEQGADESAVTEVNLATIAHNAIIEIPTR